MGGRFGEPMIGSAPMTSPIYNPLHRNSVARGPCLAGKPWITVSLKSEYCGAAAGGSSASASGTVGQSCNRSGRKTEHDRGVIGSTEL